MTKKNSTTNTTLTKEDEKFWRDSFARLTASPYKEYEDLREYDKLRHQYGTVAVEHVSKEEHLALLKRVKDLEEAIPKIVEEFIKAINK